VSIAACELRAPPPTKEGVPWHGLLVDERAANETAFILKTDGYVKTRRPGLRRAFF
jgi:hypothetical protein